MAPKVESGCSRRPRNNISQQRPSQQSKKCGLIVSLWLPMLVIIIIIYSFFFNIFRLVVVSVWTFRKCGKIQLRPPARTKIFFGAIIFRVLSSFPAARCFCASCSNKKKKKSAAVGRTKKKIKPLNDTFWRHSSAPICVSKFNYFPPKWLPVKNRFWVERISIIMRPVEWERLNRHSRRVVELNKNQLICIRSRFQWLHH